MKRYNNVIFSSTTYYWIVLLFVIIAVYYVLNRLTPIVLDDCGYARPGQTFLSVIHDQAHDYININGRILAHSFVQLIGGILGKPIFNIMNALMTTFLILLVSYVTNIKLVTNNNLFLVICSLACVWFMYPDQYVTMFMIAGSLNYIWSSVLILLFLIFYALISENTHWIKILSLCLLALIVGAWNDMYSVCVTPAIFIDLLYHKKYRNKKLLFYAICFCIGAVIVVLAPGNFARFNIVFDGNSPTPISTKFVNMLTYLLSSPILLIWGSTLVLALLRRYNKIRLNNHLTSVIIIAIIFSLAFITVSGACWPRTYFAIYTFSFILLLQEIAYVHMPNWLKTFVGVVFLLCFIGDFYQEQRTFKIQKKAVEAVIEDSKSGKDLIYWIGADSSIKSISSDVLSVESSSWKNTFFCNYYGLDSVRLYPKEIAEWMQKDIMVESDKYIMLEHFTLFPINTIDYSQNYTIVVNMGDVYVLKSKLRRLLYAMHFSCGSKIYEKKEINKKFIFLYTLVKPLLFEMALCTDTDNAFCISKNEQKFFVFNNNVFDRYQNIDLSDMQLCCYDEDILITIDN